MVEKLLSHPLFHLTVATCAGLGVVICIFPDFISRFAWVVNYAVQLMLFYLAAGLVFLFLRQSRLTFVCFGCCAILIMWLKLSVKNDSIERWRETVIRRELQPNPTLEKKPLTLKIAHVNITNIGSPEDAFAAICETNPDILSIHEVTPDWSLWLNETFDSIYPYRHTLVNIGLFGMAVFSRFPIEQVDTFFYQEIPNLKGIIQVNGEPLAFFGVHTEPALNDFYRKRLKEHLDSAAFEISREKLPSVVFGEFNAVSWSNEIQLFRERTGLIESRSGFVTMSPGGASLTEIPLDHIFFSPHFQCIGFKALDSKTSPHLGIFGTYQLKPAGTNVEKMVQ
ncbi:MAG: endonuclease/exonuclease/phosphatase family protein [Bacteroidota bacterium]